MQMIVFHSCSATPTCVQPSILIKSPNVTVRSCMSRVLEHTLPGGGCEQGVIMYSHNRHAKMIAKKRQQRGNECPYCKPVWGKRGGPTPGSRSTSLRDETRESIQTQMLADREPTWG